MSDRRPRVLVVTPRYLPEMGGVENHVDQVCRRIAGDVDVTVLTTDTTGSLATSETIHGVRVVRVRAWPRDRDYRFSSGVYREVRQGDWDVVHVQSYHTAVAPTAMLAASRAGIPYVVTFHGGGHSSRLRTALRGPQWQTLRPLLARARRLIAVADFEVGLYSRVLRVPAERFVVIPNGSDLPVVEDVPAEESRGRRIVASIGRLERYKGHHRVVEALPLVLAEEPDVELRVVGSGPYRERIEATAKRLGVSHRVTIESIPPGDRQAMATALKSYSLVVLMSEYETHPLTILEAAALGRPALVADTSGLRELAERGYAASIPFGSGAREIADGILRQLRDPAEAQPVALPTWDECARRVLGVYREVLGGEGVGR